MVWPASESPFSAPCAGASHDLRRPVQGLWPPTVAATFFPRCATGCAWTPRGVAGNRQEEAALSRPV